MLALDFHSVSTESVSLGFICPTCSYRICEVVFISEPNLDRGLLDGSHECDELNICCSNCGREFNTKLYSKRNNGLLRGFVEIEGLAKDTELEFLESELVPEEFYQIESIIDSSNIYEIFDMELANLRKINQIDITEKSTKNALLRQVYAGAITCLEVYLSDKFINTVFSQDSYLESFIVNYKDFQKEKLSLSEIYQSLREIDKKAKKSLLEIIWHNIPKVRSIYKATFDVDFPDIEKIMKIISIRHDFVHRNGKNKDGGEVDINSSDVFEVINQVELFVQTVENNMKLSKKLI